MVARARTWGVALLLSTAIALPTFGQTLNDLTGREVSADELISVLAPKQSPPPQATTGTRGLGLTAPGCQHFHRDVERGIELAPKANIAAITVQFQSGSAALTPTDKRILNSLGQALSSAALKPCCFEIQGHTDSIGSAAFNKRLSQKRAESVVDFLADHENVERDRMIPLGLGKTQPIADDATAEGRAKNRRVQVVNLGYGSSS
jgi:outer membrane protein OmpA-like peptidoglycan-associated protein